MAIATAFQAALANSIAINGTAENQVTAVNGTITGDITQGTGYLEAASQPGDYILFPAVRKVASAGATFVIKFSTSTTAFQAMTGVLDTGTAYLESVNINSAGASAATEVGSLSINIRGGTTADLTAYLIQGQSLNNGAIRTVVIQIDGATKNALAWVDGASVTVQKQGASFSSAENNTGFGYAMFAKNNRGTFDQNFSGRIYTFARLLGTGFDGASLSSNPDQIFETAADTTPPTFTVAPAASAIGQTSATVTATINETGSIFWVAVPQGEATPSVAQVISGQNTAGGTPIDAGSAVATTSLSEVASGFTAATDYKFCVVAQDDEPTPNVQAAVTVVNFTTASAGDTTPPVFTVAPAVTSVSQTTATVSATIDETGSIFWVVVPDAESTPSVAQVIAGQNAAGGAPTDAGSAVGTTTLSEGVAGMTASTAYKACFVAQDDEGVPNVQATVTTVGFTTASVPTGTIALTDLSSNAGVLWSSQSGITVDVYDPSSGALVVRKTGLTSTAGGDLDVSDAAIVAGTSYNVFITIGSAIGAVKVTAA